MSVSQTSAGKSLRNVVCSYLKDHRNKNRNLHELIYISELLNELFPRLTLMQWLKSRMSRVLNTIWVYINIDFQVFSSIPKRNKEYNELTIDDLTVSNDYWIFKILVTILALNKVQFGNGSRKDQTLFYEPRRNGWCLAGF